ncbi:hypothetical protein CT0861_02570 [Colletotrichum tofieldiae]|uniref:Uncharacterized protein n=1 Tax=Colletotrichum tofieldiae TaxID=708197 RepID=A0A166S426_9PEZI|nr:hypothetical protein CT0861_02570 [Colletotrichum tofieldiae]
MIPEPKSVYLPYQNAGWKHEASQLIPSRGGKETTRQIRRRRWKAPVQRRTALLEVGVTKNIVSERGDTSPQPCAYSRARGEGNFGRTAGLRRRTSNSTTRKQQACPPLPQPPDDFREIT